MQEADKVAGGSGGGGMAQGRKGDADELRGWQEAEQDSASSASIVHQNCLPMDASLQHWQCQCERPQR